MHVKNMLSYLVVVLAIAMITSIGVGFTPQEESFFTITGTAVYNTKTYPDLRIKVRVTEDGKQFTNFTCNSKGRFETRIFPGHIYMFYFSENYHATSKVEINTNLPEKLTGEYIGGLFSFDCEMFERMEGLNLSILNNPLVKIKYNEEKNDFEYDRRYTEKMLYNLDGFKEQLAEMKQRRKEVLKDETEAKKSGEVAVTAPVVKERKPIEFEIEKEKPKEVNKRGARNILDMAEEEEEEKEEIAAELKEADSIMEQSEAIVMEKTEAPKEMSAEDLALEQALDETEFVTLKVIPKRVDMSAPEPDKKEDQEKMEETKQKIQADVEMNRIAQETKMRDEVRSFNNRATIQNEKRLANKKIQNERVGNLIKSVAIAEIYYKRENYGVNPILHDDIDPGIYKSEHNTWWVDKEYTTLMYPSQSVRYRKEVYPLGITYYYKGDEEIDEKTYCSGIEKYSKQKITCEN